MLEYPTQWDGLLPYAQASYNGALHSALGGNTPHYLMFARDSNLDLPSLHPEGPYDDSDQGRRCQIYAKCLEMARAAIFQTQETRRKRINLHRSPIADIGDVVYVIKHYVNEPSYKILPKYLGPFRIVTLTGQVALLRSFSTGAYCQVHLRHAKLVPHEALTKTENPNVGEPFATRGYSMLPEGRGVTYVKKHEHLTAQDVADKALPGSVTQPLVPQLRPEILAEFEDPVPSPRQRETKGMNLRQRDGTMSWVEEDPPVVPTVAPTLRRGRPKGSKNKVSPPNIRVSVEASDTEDENQEARGASEEALPIARRTRSRGKPLQVSMVTMETEDLNFGLILRF